MNESMLIHSSDSPFFSYKGDLSLGQHVSVHSQHPLPKKKRNGLRCFQKYMVFKVFSLQCIKFCKLIIVVIIFALKAGILVTFVIATLEKMPKCNSLMLKVEARSYKVQ